MYQTNPSLVHNKVGVRGELCSDLENFVVKTVKINVVLIHMIFISRSGLF